MQKWIKNMNKNNISIMKFFGNGIDHGLVITAFYTD